LVETKHEIISLLSVTGSAIMIEHNGVYTRGGTKTQDSWADTKNIATTEKIVYQNLQNNMY
jgi:hypothetical protein